MTDERWQEARVELEALLDLDPGAREAALADLLVRDRGLGVIVGELLEAEQRAGDSFLTGPAPLMGAGALGSSSPQDPAAPQGDPSAPGARRAGPFFLRHRIATGRASSVWRAARVEGGFEQEVVVKLVDRRAAPTSPSQPGMERRALARIDHPGVVRLVDGGAADAETEWIAMESLEAEPLLAHCDRLGLGVRERVTLLRDLALAVSACHAAEVLHLDIAPGNVLVTGSGTVTLVDFGSAQILDGGAEESNAERPFTPAFGAPERFRGTRVSAATDVYSLGALLHAALTGTPPISIEGLSPLNARRRVETEPAARLGAAARSLDAVALARRGARSTGSLARALTRGGLQDIVTAALAKEPEARTQSSADFAEDLDRWLAGAPVKARRQRALEPLVRAARTRPWITLGAAITALALMGGALTMVYAAGEMRAAAAREAKLVEDSDRMLISLRRSAEILLSDVHNSLLPIAGTRTALDRLISAGVEISEDHSDPDLTIWLADALVKRGLTQLEAAGGSEARRAAARADLDRAFAGIDPLHNGPGSVTVRVARIGWQGSLTRAILADTECRMDDVLSAFDDTEAWIDRACVVPGDTMQEIEVLYARGNAIHVRMELAREAGQYRLVLADAQKRRAIFEEIRERSPHMSPRLQAEWLGSLVELDALTAGLGRDLTLDLGDAAEAMDRILELVDASPHSIEICRPASTAAACLSRTLVDRGRLGEASDLLARAIERIAPRADLPGGWSESRRVVGALKLEAGMALAQSGDRAEARAVLAGTLDSPASTRPTHSSRSMGPSAVEWEALVHTALARTELEDGDAVAAARSAAAALATLERLPPACQGRVRTARLHADVYRIQGAIDETAALTATPAQTTVLLKRALDWYDRALETLTAVDGDDLLLQSVGLRIAVLAKERARCAESLGPR